MSYLNFYIVEITFLEFEIIIYMECQVLLINVKRIKRQVALENRDIQLIFAI